MDKKKTCKEKKIDYDTWLKNLLNGKAVTKASEEIGLSRSTLTNMVKNENIPAETVIKLARTYGQHPVTALVETGYLEHDEARNYTPLTNAQLIQLLARRLDLDPTLLTPPTTS